MSEKDSQIAKRLLITAAVCAHDFPDGFTAGTWDALIPLEVPRVHLLASLLAMLKDGFLRFTEDGLLQGSGPLLELAKRYGEFTARREVTLE